MIATTYEAIVQRHEETIATQERTIHRLRKQLQAALTELDLALTHIDDANRFGWTDRLTDAESIITAVYCDTETVLHEVA